MNKTWLLLVCLFFLIPLNVLAQEDGWKNLKWGMTLKEIEQVYTDETTGTKCERMREEDPFWVLGGSGILYIDLDNTIGRADLETVKEVTCAKTSYGEFSSIGLLTYKGKLFGKVINISDPLADTKEAKEERNEILRNLKGKYPNGNLSYRNISDLFYPNSKEARIFKGQKYGVFEYKTDKLFIFANYTLCFYDPKILNELLSGLQSIKLKQKEQKEQKIKNLF